MKNADGVKSDNKKIYGQYANYFKIGHNAFEFLLDFGQLYLENKTAQFHTRIIINPIYIKPLLETIRESVEHYERKFGAIKEIQK